MEFLADVYQKWKQTLHINDKSKGYHLFMVIRTFILFNLGQYFDCVSSVKEAAQMIRYSLTTFKPEQFLTISSGKLGVEYTPYALMTLVIACALWFVVSLLKENWVDIEKTLGKITIHCGIWNCLINIYKYSAIQSNVRSKGVHLCAILKKIWKIIICAAILCLVVKD